MVYNICIWMKVLMLKSGLSMEYYPQEIFTQQSVDYKKYCRAEFGSYVEDITYAMVTNGQTMQTKGCIAMGASGNRQGSLK